MADAPAPPEPSGSPGPSEPTRSRAALHELAGAADAGAPEVPDVRHDLPELTRADAAALYTSLIGEPAELTWKQAAAAAGLELAEASRLRRAMGFPDVSDDEVACSAADVQALRDARWLVESGWLAAGDLVPLTRTTGRAMASLAAAQMEVAGRIAAQLLRAGDPGGAGPADPAAPGPVVSPEVRLQIARSAAGSVLPVVSRLQQHVWRRHLLAMTVAQVGAPVGPTQRLAVLIADLSGFSERTRALRVTELGDLVARFEECAESVVVGHGARVVKLLGDGILAVARDLDVALAVATDLVALPDGDRADPPLPPVRAGVALGEVLLWQGDVHGEPVVLAARLCGVARPGSVLLDRHASAAAKAQLPHRRLRPLPPLRVRGYDRLLAHRLDTDAAR